MKTLSAMPRYIQLDGWIFEIKSVCALKVSEYGLPYDAISNITVNGDNAYIDGLMTKEDQRFTRQDFDTIIEFCRRLGLSTASFDRFKNGQLVSESVNLKPQASAKVLQLVNGRG